MGLRCTLALSFTVTLTGHSPYSRNSLFWAVLFCFKKQNTRERSQGYFRVHVGRRLLIRANTRYSMSTEVAAWACFLPENPIALPFLKMDSGSSQIEVEMTRVCRLLLQLFYWFKIPFWRSLVDLVLTVLPLRSVHLKNLQAGQIFDAKKNF